MNLGPERLPSPDAETAATALGDGLQHLPTEVLSTAGGLLTSVEPHTLVLGTVVGTLCKAEVTEYSRKLDVRLQEYVEEHGGENAIAARIAAGVSRLLPDGEELNQAALQAARGDSDALRGLLEEYHTDEQRRAELDDAVERILTGDFDDVEETLTEAFDTSDADAAQALLYDFAELVRTRQVQQTLETVLELDGRFDALADDLDAMQRELEDNITQGLIEVDLQDEGFTRLSSFVFDRTVDEPEQAWRAGLGLVHVRRGYAVDRRRRDGTNVTGALFEQLRSGETPVNRIVRGPAGSGKSTVCKQVACRWYDDPETGPVFYRQSGSGGREFESTGKLRSAIRTRTGNGRVLVVVEDAVRPATEAIYEVMREFRGTDIDVSFLLDARRGELDEFEDPARMETGAADALREVLGRTERDDVPAFDPEDPAECREIVERFQEKTDREVTHSAEYIHGEIVTSEAELGELVYLTYFLPVGGEEAVGLEGDVRAKYRTILDPTGKSQREDLAEFDEDLRRDVALLMNLLNASRVGIHPELVHALGHVHGNDKETHREIREIREALGGWMLYPHAEEESNIERTTHELWSALYLGRVAARYEETGDVGFGTSPKDRFERCVNALFRFCDDESLRQTIRQGFEGSDVLDGHAEEPERAADGLVRQVFELGERRPVLGPLYGTSDGSGIRLPEVCSAETARGISTRRGHIHLDRGAFDAARTEYGRARELSEELGDRAGIAKSLGNLGLVARQQGEYESAREYHEDSLEIKEQLGDRAGIATSLGNLGNVALQQGEYESAREYHEDSLEIKEQLRDRAGIASSLNNLGLVARKQDEYESAREYHEDSLEINEQLDDRAGIATSLNNLGLVAQAQGEYESAREYHEDSLEINEQLGDRASIATSLNNLGLVARQQGEYESAREYHEDSLEINEELGDRAGIAKSFGNLGLVARQQGEYESAREYYEDSLEIEEQLDDRAGIATSLGNLGLVAQAQGEYESAREYFERCVRVFIDIGALRRALTGLDNLVSTCEELGRAEEALEHCETAIQLVENSDIPEIETEASSFRARRVRLSDEDPEERLPQLHLHACGHVLEGEGQTALELFEAAWNLRAAVPDDGPAHRMGLAAGLATAVHVRILDDYDAGGEFEEIVETASENRDDLTASARVLLDYLEDGEAAVSPDELREMADSEEMSDATAMEARAFAVLIALASEASGT